MSKGERVALVPYSVCAGVWYVNGKKSGPLWHWLLMLTRHTTLTSTSMSDAISAWSVPNTAACCPNSHSLR